MRDQTRWANQVRTSLISLFFKIRPWWKAPTEGWEPVSDFQAKRKQCSQQPQTQAQKWEGLARHQFISGTKSRLTVANWQGSWRKTPRHQRKTMQKSLFVWRQGAVSRRPVTVCPPPPHNASIVSRIWLLETPRTVALQASLSAHGIFQARVLEWAATSSSRDQTGDSWNFCTGRWILHYWEALHPLSIPFSCLEGWSRPFLLHAFQIAGLGGTPGGEEENYTHTGSQASLGLGRLVHPLRSWKITRQAAPQGTWYWSGL